MSNYAWRGWALSGFIMALAMVAWRATGHRIDPVIAVSAFMCVSTCGAIMGVLLEKP